MMNKSSTLINTLTVTKTKTTTTLVKFALIVYEGDESHHSGSRGLLKSSKCPTK